MINLKNKLKLIIFVIVFKQKYVYKFYNLISGFKEVAKFFKNKKNIIFRGINFGFAALHLKKKIIGITAREINPFIVKS